MMSKLYHFVAERPAEDLKLSPDHILSGYVAQYLKNYQLDGIRFLYKHFENNQSCILNDENGLGKTATVVAFLETVLPPNASRKCLIIVKDSDRLQNWLFHLNVLTKLTSKVAQKEEDIGYEIVYLAKWDVIQRYCSLSAHNFDCVIVDNRGDLLSNKICSGFLLRNYENKVSLIISSADVAVDLQQFHIMLRLCGRLEKKYENVTVFEEKFALPSTMGTTEDVNILEAYFLRREKIINFCRDFRLRRYRHQYEDVLPLVQHDEYEKNLKMWGVNPVSRSYSTSSSIKIVTSSSEKDTEDLLNSYFEAKQDEQLNNEVAEINANKGKSTEVLEVVETEDMSPLIFASDSEERGLERKETVANSHVSNEFIIPIVLEDDSDEVEPKKSTSTEDNKKKIEKSESILKRKTRLRAPILRKTAEVEFKDKSLDPVNVKRLRSSVKKEQKNDSNLRRVKSGRVQKSKFQQNNINSRSLRSDHATRSKSSKNKYLIIDLTLDDTQKKKRKARNQKVVTKKQLEKKAQKKEVEKHPKEVNVKKENHDKNVANRRSTRRTKVDVETNPKHTDKTTRRSSRKQELSKPKNKNINNNTENNISKSVNNRNSDKSDSIQKDKNTIIEIDSDVPGNSNSLDQYLNGKYNFNVDLNKKIQSEIHQNANDIHFVSPQHPVIVLSGSTEGSSQQSSNASSKRLLGLRCIRPSPDLFSSAEEYELFCSQKNKSGSDIKRINPGTKIKESRKSCLDLLERDFHGQKVYETEEVFAVTSNGTILRNPEDADVSGMKSRSISVFQKNKITKYLIGTETQSLDSHYSNDNIATRKNGDHYLKTPKRQKSLTLKKSPKATGSSNLTPNSLTKWLIKNDDCSDRPSKTSKRRRLDLSFDKSK